jgi:hypothetical protein
VVFGSGELELAIDVVGLAEEQMQNPPVYLIGDRGEHL